MTIELKEQAENPGYTPDVQRVMGQDLKYPSVNSCITITHVRTGPSQPYLVGVHLGVLEHPANPSDFPDTIRPGTVAQAIDRLKSLVETRTVYLTKRRPHATFLIGWLALWRQNAQQRYNELCAYIQSWRRSRGTNVILYDLDDLEEQATYDIKFTTAGNIQIERRSDNVIRKTGTWYPNANL